MGGIECEQEILCDSDAGRMSTQEKNGTGDMACCLNITHGKKSPPSCTVVTSIESLQGMQSYMLEGNMKKQLRIGDIVRLKITDTKLRARLGSVPSIWSGTGIILDIMEMADGFPMIEVCFEQAIEWFQDLELELVQT